MAAAVESFVTSPNYNHTRWIWPYLVREPSLSGDHLRRLEYAVRTNSQVYDAVAEGKRIPDLVAGLVIQREPPDPWAGGSEEPPF